MGVLLGVLRRCGNISSASEHFLGPAVPTARAASPSAEGVVMPLLLEWPDLALRLAFAVLGGVLIGLDRDEHGRPAGLRTTLLVCLAATLAMIEVNLLLGQVGKAPNSFVNL